MATDRFGNPIVEKSKTDRFGNIIVLDPQAGPEAVGPGGAQYTEEQKREYGTLSAPPPAPQRFIEEYIRPFAQEAGAIGGGLIGGGLTAPTGPGALVGAVTGGGLGFAIGDEVVDLIEDWLGYREPKPLALELQESAEDIATGVTYELVGHSLFPGLKQAAKPILWAGGKFTKKGAKAAAGEIIAAMTSKGPLIVKNWDEARALENAIPGLRFDLGQVTQETGTVKFLPSRGETAADIATRQAQQREMNTEAIQRFVQESKEAGAGTRELRAPLKREKTLLEEAEEIAQANLEREMTGIEAVETPADIGDTIYKELQAGETAAREEASRLFQEVPEQSFEVGDLYKKLQKIMKPTHADEGPRKFPGVIERKIKGIESRRTEIPDESLTGKAVARGRSGKWTSAQARAKEDIYKKRNKQLLEEGKLEEAMEMANEAQSWRETAEVIEGTFKGRVKPKYAPDEMDIMDLQGFRSELLEDIRTAKDKGLPRSYLRRLNEALNAVDEVLGGKPKEKGETVYHTRYKGESGEKVPITEDAYFGDKAFHEKFGHEFGDDTTELVIPENTKILDLDDGSKEAKQFMDKVKKEWPKDKEFIRNMSGRSLETHTGFDDYWANMTDDANTPKTLAQYAKEMGYEGVKYKDKVSGTTEYNLSKELINKISNRKPRDVKPEELLYHSSRQTFEKGKPDFDAYYGDIKFKEDILDDIVREPGLGLFGKEQHAIKLPKDARILNVSNDSPKALEFFARLARKHGKPEEFIQKILRNEEGIDSEFMDLWGDKKYHREVLKDMGYEAANYYDENFILKELSERSQAYDPKTLRPFGETIPSVELQKAQKYFRENVIEKYGKGTIKNILRGEETIQDAMIAGKLFKPGPKGQQVAREFNKALGENEAAKSALKDYIDQSFYDYLGKNLEVTKGGLNRWLKSHKHALKEYGLEGEYDSIVKAKEALDNARTKRKEFENSAASRVLNADVNEVVSKAFSGKESKEKIAKDLMDQLRSGEFVRTGKTRNAALKDLKTGEVYRGRQTHPELWDERAQELAERYDMPIGNILEEFNLEKMYEPGFINNKGEFVNRAQAVREMAPIWKTNDKALAGLQNAMIDEILTDIPLESPEGMRELLTSKKMGEQLRKYDAAIRVVFKNAPEKVKAMHQVRKALQKAEYKTPIKGEEDRAKTTIENMARNYGHRLRSATGIAVDMIKALGNKIGMKNVEKVFNRAVFDPNIAFELSKLKKGGKPEKVISPLVNQLIVSGVIATDQLIRGEE